MGRLVHFGATAAYGSARGGLWKWPGLVANYLRRPMVDPGELTASNRAVFGFNLIWLTDREDMLATALADMMATRSEGRPPLVDETTFHFEDLPKALAHLQSGTSAGKVVVRVDPPPGTAPIETAPTGTAR